MRSPASSTARFGADGIHRRGFHPFPTPCKFIALMPQWDFLNFLSRARPPLSGLSRPDAGAGDRPHRGGRHRGRGPCRDGGRVGSSCGAARGRLRRPAFDWCAKAGLEVEDLGAPMDVLGSAIGRRPDDPDAIMGVFEAGHICVVINRGDYWQCGYVIPKDSFAAVHGGGLRVPRPAGAHHAVVRGPGRRARLDWDQIKLLTVAVDRLKRWYRQRPHLHRRCRSRNVAGRRRRHQSRRAGRGCRRQHSGVAAAGWCGRRR